MVTSQMALKKYGDPKLENNMVVWDVPGWLQIGVIPKKIYCNRDLIKPLANALENLVKRGYVSELKTWDGCFNIRKKRGLNSMSLHAWGLAFDINAAWNQLGKEPTFSEGFIKCITDAGFDWGGYWKRKDGMHFQLSSI